MFLIRERSKFLVLHRRRLVLSLLPTAEQETKMLKYSLKRSEQEFVGRSIDVSIPLHVPLIQRGRDHAEGQTS